MPTKKKLSMKSKITSFLISTLLVSCATQEEIDRRELLKKLSIEMQGQQKIVKGLLLATQRIERSLGTVSGKIEENEYQETISLEATVNEIKQQIAKIEEFQTLSSGKITKNQEDLEKLAKLGNEQKRYISKVSKELKSINSEVDIEKASSAVTLANAIKLYQHKKYDIALEQFQEILRDPKRFSLKSTDTPRIYHNLGIIYFIRKDYQNSQVYLSKLFTEFPENGLNSSGLYHLGLSFKRLKNKEMMKQTLNLLTEKFPKSRYTKKAKKLL
jgi:TolA-binding protein